MNHSAAFFGRAALLLAFFLSAFVGGCDSGFSSKKTTDVIVIPAQYSFSRLNLDEQVERVVEIQSTGTSELIIRGVQVKLANGTKYRLDYRDLTTSNFQLGLTSDGENQFDFPIYLPPEESLFFKLTVTGKGETIANGEVVLDVNYQDGELSIPIVFGDSGAQLTVTPGALDFERVRAGETKLKTVTVTNVGGSVLKIEHILINGSQDFSPLLGEIDANGNIIDPRDPRQLSDEQLAELLNQLDGDGQDGLAPNSSIELHVQYAPKAEGPDVGELSILSNDRLQGDVKVSLTANGNTSCLTTSPAAIEFATSLINRTDSRPLSLESCGGTELRITGIHISEDSDPAFSIDEDSLPPWPLTLPAATAGQAAPNRSILLNFSPKEQRVYNGTLIVESDDPIMPQHEIHLLGRGILNNCPRAAISKNTYEIEPLDVILLDGSSSIDPDGADHRPVKYEWIITSRPEGSLSRPLETFFDIYQPSNGGRPDDVTTPTAYFFADLAGTYTAELRVRDNLGLGYEACASAVATATIIAVPKQAIHVQLVWHNPDDDDETDGYGADLDLHLRHPTSNAWLDNEGDCYFSNPTPDWGQKNTSEDDPTLDIDDSNGGGPENINLTVPQDTSILGKPYMVGVHYYHSKDRRDPSIDYGVAQARVRIYLNGELAWDYSEVNSQGYREMEAANDFWEVADIYWQNAENASVETRDRYYRQPPSAQ